MPWNSTCPLGSVSVKANRAIAQQNTTYTEVTMGNSVVGTNTVTTRDHFWDVGSNEDGRHRFIQSPAFTVGALPANPVIGTGMDFVLYPKLKLAAESPDQQDVQYFGRNASAIMQMLGIRACVVFNVLLAAPNTVTIKYAHNIASVVRNGTGLFTVTYSTALPSNSYLLIGGGIRNISTSGSNTSEVLLEVQGASSLNNVKSTTLAKIMTKSDGGTEHDPLQAWLVCFGG